MNVINREELKVKLEQGKNVKLVMAMDRNAYERAHIPGSVYFENLSEAAQQLRPEDEVVVYCSTQWCNASIRLYHLLERLGFNRLARFAGGLDEWSSAGYPLEGSLAA